MVAATRCSSPSADGMRRQKSAFNKPYIMIAIAALQRASGGDPTHAGAGWALCDDFFECAQRQPELGAVLGVQGGDMVVYLLTDRRLAAIEVFVSDAEEMAEAIEFLYSEQNTYTTGIV